MPSDRPLYPHAVLQRIFRPASIAVVGASTNPDAFGSRTLARLVRNYRGRIHAVNPRYERIGDMDCFPAVGAIPEPVDLVVIAVPLEGVEAALLECAGHDVGGVLIYASGYAETGHADRIAMQARLGELAREQNTPALGPNCLGFFNFAIRAGISFTRSDIRIDAFREPGVGLVSQSGAMAFSQSQGAFRGVSMSHVIATGNSSDIDVADIVAYLAHDPDCRSIVCVFEGLAAPQRLMQAGQIAWQQDKPVIACKLGASAAGAQAALSHSGSLAGSLDGWRAAFERSGIIMLNEVDGLLEAASFFAKAPRRPAGEAVAAIGISGGALVATVDKAEAFGIAMPQPVPAVQQRLAARIPEFGSPRNPCDVTAMASRDAGMIPDCVDALASDPQYCTVLYPQTTLFSGTGKELRGISEACARHGKIATTVWMSGWLGGHGVTEAEADPNMAVFYSLNRYFWTLREWIGRGKRRERTSAGATLPSRISPPEARQAAERIIRAAPAAVLTEREAKSALACYGIPVVTERLVQCREDAVREAGAMACPVVLKAESPLLPHKTEADVIRLNLRSPRDVAAAFDEVMANARKVCSAKDINGILVQPMVSGGIEMMAGARVDPLFGPMIMAGPGGVLVELIRDTSTALAPLALDDARLMLDQLKSQPLLDGFRGALPVDRDALADIIVRLGEFMSDQRHLVAELDINPLICSGARIIAVDALIARV